MRAAVIALLVGCADVAESPHDASLGFDSCDDIASGGGWENDFLPQSTSRAFYSFYATPIEPAGSPIDAVVGFSNGRTDAFADLGPIVRFNPQGFVDARNGSSYQAAQPFPYNVHTTYRFEIEVNLHTHTYDAFVYEDLPRYDRIQIANDFAFRSEQASVARLDNIGRKIDSATGSLNICGFYAVVYDNEMPTGAGAGWHGVTFPPQSGRFRVEVEGQAGTPDTDAVIGLGRTVPRYFSDLAAIVRFNPAGHLDVRDGSTYRYDVFHPFSPVQNYVFVFDIDVPAKRYSVTVWNGDIPRSDPVPIAVNYAFRTEQQSVSSLGALGQIVDSPQGFLFTDELLIAY